MKQVKKGNITQLIADNGFVHKIGSDVYGKCWVMLPSDSIDMFEEVAEIPAYTKSEYDSKVAELVREKYSADEEFAIQRKAINAAFSPSVTSAESVMIEYQAYNDFVEECKILAKNPELYKSNSEYDSAEGKLA